MDEDGPDVDLIDIPSVDVDKIRKKKSLKRKSHVNADNSKKKREVRMNLKVELQHDQ